MALVLDEYGGLAGLVTRHDILVGMVGHLLEGKPFGESTGLRRQDGSWLLDGRLPIDEVRDLLQMGDPFREEGRRFQTLGGFAAAALGHIPTPGEDFEVMGRRFQVVEMDGRRVAKVRVTYSGAKTGETE